MAEDILQQESLIESQLETYGSQLSLVEQQLEAGPADEVADDLVQLKSNLAQLIDLTKENLLETKKQRLLLTLQDSEGDHRISKPSTGTDVARDGEKKGEEGGEEGGEEEEDDELHGMKCQAPVMEAWGALNYHNAMIVCREPQDITVEDVTTDTYDDLNVRVLFTHPTYNAMKPCSFFLKGACKFDDDSCKFSHGHVVPFSDLRPYQDPDFSLVHTGSKCMAKHSDDLWYPATISTFGEVFTVHFTTINATVQVEPAYVLPIESSDKSGSSDDSGWSDLEEEEEEEGVRVFDWKPTGPQYALGEWEKHTTGIGSKLLVKMGYQFGKGLGREGEGRVEPVQIVVLPSGKSLDVCAEMREAKKLRRPDGQEVGKRRRKKRGKKTATESLSVPQSEKTDIFDFLNAKIKKKDSSSCIVKDPSHARSQGDSLNVQLFKVQEEMKLVRRRRSSLLKTLSRHKGRNKAMEDHVQEQMANVEKSMSDLQREEDKIQRSLHLKSERRKLSIF